MLAADRSRIQAISERALAMAERLDDPASLVSALRARQMACSGAEGNAERLVLGGRMLAVAARSGDAADALWGHLWRFDALLQAGRVADAEAEIDRLRADRGGAAPADGPPAPAAQPDGAGVRARPVRRCHAHERGVRGPRARRWAPGAAATGQSLRLLIASLTGGDPGDVSWFLGNPALEMPFTALSRACFAAMLIGSGRTSEARALFDGLPEPGSPRIPAFMALAVEVMRATLVADLGDAATAEAGYRLLLPHAALHAVGGAGAITTSGSMHLFLGLTASAAGRYDAAVRHLRTAIGVNDGAGLAPFAALARYRLAVALQARGRAADAAEAVGLAVAAGDAADRLGMRPLRAQVDALTAIRNGGVLSRRETEIAELVGRGLTNRQIAAAAHISERTVETHVQHVLAKLGFSGRAADRGVVGAARSGRRSSPRSRVTRRAPRHRSLPGRLRRAADRPPADGATVVAGQGRRVGEHPCRRPRLQAAELDEPPVLAGGAAGRVDGAQQGRRVTRDHHRRGAARHPHELGVDPGLVKDGVEAHLQELLAAHPTVFGDGYTLVRREYMTAIGPVDLLCVTRPALRSPSRSSAAARSTASSSSRATSS